MKHYQAFLEDPGQISAFDGQRYVVLCPDDAVADVQRYGRMLLESLGDDLPISYVRRAHVTLAGFPKGSSLEQVQDLIAEWAETVPPLLLAVEGLGTLPPPAKIAVVRMRKTPELFDAFRRLREMATARGLPPIDAIPVDEWVFHMSIAFCSSLDEEAWAAVVKLLAATEVPAVACLAGQAEIAAFDDGVERPGGTVAFRGGRPSMTA